MKCVSVDPSLNVNNGSGTIFFACDSQTGSGDSHKPQIYLKVLKMQSAIMERMISEDALHHRTEPLQIVPLTAESDVSTFTKTGFQETHPFGFKVSLSDEGRSLGSDAVVAHVRWNIVHTHFFHQHPVCVCVRTCTGHALSLLGMTLGVVHNSPRVLTILK